MSVSQDTVNPLDAKVYANHPFTYDRNTNTVQWGEMVPTDMFGAIDIEQGKLTGRWWEQGVGVLCTNEVRSITMMRSQPSPSGASKVSRLLCFIENTRNKPGDRSEFECVAARALISEAFDPETGKPVDVHSCQSTAVPRSTQTSAIDVTRDSEAGK